MKGALQALGLPPEKLDVAPGAVRGALPRRPEGGDVHRSGEFVTLRELRNEVGNDACRFFYVLRSRPAHLDFDLDLAKSQSNENPVYYIQYAHARLCSVRGSGTALADLGGADLGRLDNERELVLCARLTAFPEVVQNAAADYAPHQIAFYLKGDLAGEFHSYYNAERMLVDDEGLKAGPPGAGRRGAPGDPQRPGAAGVCPDSM